MGIIDRLPEVKAVIAWGIEAIPEKYTKDSRVHLYKDFMKIGKDVKDKEVIDIMESQRPGMCAVLIYTSGTTGNPKGVMLSHDNLAFTSQVSCETQIGGLAPLMDVTNLEHRMVSFLPLSHIAGLVSDLMMPLAMACTVFFAKPDALQGTIVESLQWARPTIFMAIPRLWEKFEDKLKELAASKPAVLQAVSGWAKGHGTDKVMKQKRGESAGMMFSLANTLILSKIKQALGLD